MLALAPTQGASARGIDRTEDQPEDHREVWYDITDKGQDVVPILTAFIQHGAKHRAKEVFTDKKPREIEKPFPRGREYRLGRLYNYARA